MNIHRCNFQINKSLCYPAGSVFYCKEMNSMSSMRKALLLIMVLIVGAVVPAFAQDATPEVTMSPANGEVPAKIDVMMPGLFPEGIAWDATGRRFFLSSLSGQG